MSFLVMPHGVLCPADPGTERRIEKMKHGSVVHGDFKQARNYENHKRFFALMNIAFEAWTPGDLLDGVKPEKNYDEFRKMLIIRAGYYTQVWNLDGTFSLVAKSMSFRYMGEVTFKEMFSNIVQVVIDNVLVNYTKDDVDRVVDEVIRF